MKNLEYVLTHNLQKQAKVPHEKEKERERESESESERKGERDPWAPQVSMHT